MNGDNGNHDLGKAAAISHVGIPHSLALWQVSKHGLWIESMNITSTVKFEGDLTVYEI